MSPLLDAAGVELIVRNSAMGGTSDMPYSYCAARHLGEDADLVVWEWMMFQGPCDQSGFTCSKEIYLRQAFMQCNRAATTLFRYGDPREPNRDANESSIQDLNMDQVWDEDAGFWQDYRWITEKYGSVGAIALDIRPIVESRDNQEKWSKEKWWLADKIGPGAAGWHPGPHGHDFIGKQLARNYLMAFTEALQAVIENPNAPQEAVLKEASNPISLPKPVACDPRTCSRPASCFTTIEPQIPAWGNSLQPLLSSKEPLVILSRGDRNAVRDAERKGDSYLDYKMGYAIRR